MIIKISVALLATIVVGLYLLSFGRHDQTISFAMWSDKYELEFTDSFIKVLSIITGVSSLIFLYLGFEHTVNKFWGLSLIITALAASVLGFQHFFGFLIEPLWWMISFLISMIIILVLLAIVMNDNHIHHSARHR